MSGQLDSCPTDFKVEIRKKIFSQSWYRVPCQRERISEVKGEGAVFTDTEIVQYTGYKPRTSFKLYHL